MLLQNQFWAAKKIYKPCGMFTYGHLILFILSIAILAILIYVSRNINNEQITVVTRIFAFIITILESIKIGFNFYYGYTAINSLVPASYCAIFIYSLWISGYGKRTLKVMSDAFLAGACIIAGSMYLIFPSTAIVMYPTWHYLSMYSMFYHAMMIYIGILYIYKGGVKLNKKVYKVYAIYYTVFALIAFLLNKYSGSNFMFLNYPGNLPFKVLDSIYLATPQTYRILIYTVYLTIPYWLTVYLKKLLKL